jgi:hypothetical protein
MPFNLFKGKDLSSKGKKKQDDRKSEAASGSKDRQQMQAFYTEVHKCYFDEKRLERFFRTEKIASFSVLAHRIIALNKPDFLPIDAMVHRRLDWYERGRY